LKWFEVYSLWFEVVKNQKPETRNLINFNPLAIRFVFLQILRPGVYTDEGSGTLLIYGSFFL